MTTTITRHPDDANLMSYAAGNLPEPLSAVVASHISLCRKCQAEMRILRSLGGALLADDTLSGGRDLTRQVAATLPSGSAFLYCSLNNTSS